MRKNFIFKSCLFALASMAVVACDDDINVGAVDTDTIAVPDNGVEVAYVTDAAGKRTYSNIEFRDNTTTQLYVNTQAPVSGATTVTFTYDANVLTEYNKSNGTEFKAMPQSFVSFDNGGVATIAAGTNKAVVEYTLTSDGSLDHKENYVIPLKVTISGAAQLGENDNTKIIFVRDLTNLPDATKYVKDANGNMVPGVKIFSCPEVNDTNPLSLLSFTLKNSGKPMFDAIVLFSSNINYNTTTGRVYINNNDNITAVFSNYDKYLKPLKDRGIKIYLSILGNHDCAGISTLADETAREFAKEIKAMCDAYDLDGVFWDDEYTTDPDVLPPGFVRPINAGERASRLIYEVWKVQPHRDNIAYNFGSTMNLQPVDGVPVCDYCQYSFNNYGAANDLTQQYPGMPRSNVGLWSQEFAQGNTAPTYGLEQIRNEGWGCHMIFAMNPIDKSHGGPREDWVVMRMSISLNNMARILFDDELVDDGVRYPVDW